MVVVFFFSVRAFFHFFSHSHQCYVEMCSMDIPPVCTCVGIINYLVPTSMCSTPREIMIIIIAAFTGIWMRIRTQKTTQALFVNRKSFFHPSLPERERERTRWQLKRHFSAIFSFLPSFPNGAIGPRDMWVCPSFLDYGGRLRREPAAQGSSRHYTRQFGLVPLRRESRIAFLSLLSAHVWLWLSIDGWWREKSKKLGPPFLFPLPIISTEQSYTCLSCKVRSSYTMPSIVLWGRQ